MAQEWSAEESFGVQVRSMRVLRGWTQEHLRERLRESSGIDLSSTAMARLEQGKRPIRFNEVAALAALLDLDLHTYSTRTIRLTPEEYDNAREALDALQEQEKAARQQLAEMRDRHDAEASSAEREIRRLSSERLRLAQAIRDHEERERG